MTDQLLFKSSFYLSDFELNNEASRMDDSTYRSASLAINDEIITAHLMWSDSVANEILSLCEKIWDLLLRFDPILLNI